MADETVKVWDGSQWVDLRGPQGEVGPQGPRGLMGPQGNPGQSVRILGTLPSPQDLPPTGDPGDAWLIQDDLWVWDELNTRWEDIGRIVGPQGPKGDQGDQGVRGSRWWISGKDGIVDPGDVPDPIDGDLFLYPGSGDVFVYDATAQWTFSRNIIGPTGPANSLAIGTVQKGTDPEAQITGTPPNQTLSLTLPQGDQGPAATIAVGTVSTLPAGAQATVTNTGTTEAAVFDFGIPKGADGAGDIIPIGSIFPFAGVTVPDGWLLCDGSTYDPGTYPKLSAAIGATFGTKTPDLRDRFALGAGGSRSLGTAGGAATISKVVAHTHTVTGSVAVSVSQDNGLSVSGSAGSGGDHQHGLQVSGTTTSDNPAHNHTGLSSVAGNRTNTKNGTGTSFTYVESIGTIEGGTGTTSIAHSHTVISSGTSGSAGSHQHSISGATGAHGHSASGSLSGASAASTGDATVDVLNPFLAINYIIKAA